ncbi:MAG: PAS domain S-box protein [Gammaproteobacteria bacterium]
MTSHAHANETARLAALDRYEILNTAPEPAFDALTRLAARICKAPIAALSLIDGHRQWFKSTIGLDIEQTPRCVAFCAHAISQPEILIVPDALADARFATAPLVTNAPHLRSYAGAPLVTPEGHALGALCVMDRVPRDFDAEQCELLSALAAQAMTQLELRCELQALRPAQDRLELILNAAGEGICGLDAAGRVMFVNPAATRLLGRTEDELVGKDMHQLIHHSYADGRPCPGARCPILAVLRDGQARKVDDEVFWRGDGTSFPASYVSTPIKTAGQPSGAVVVFHDVTEAKRSERQLRLITDAVPSLIAYVDSTQHYRFNNRAYEAWFKLSRDELLGKHVQEVVGDTAFESIRGHLQKVLEGHPVSYESRMAYKTGGTRHTSTSLVPDIDAQGKVKGYVALVNDISARVRAAEERDRFFTLPLHLMCIVSMEGYFKRLNPVFETTLGFSQKELLSRPFLDFVHPDDRKATLAEFERVSAGASTQRLENRCRCKDGSYRWLAWAMFPVLEEGLVYAVALDVSERKLATEALRASDARKSAMLATALDCVIAIDHLGRIIEFNPAAEATFGYTRAAVLGEDLADKIIPPGLRAAHRKGLLHYLATGEAPVLGKRIEIEAMRADGSVFPVELAITRIPVEGTPEFTAYLRDITERKQTEERLHYLANYDGLTNLPNRVLLTNRLQQSLAQAQRYGRSVAILFIDLDRFKSVNDALGHEVGDLLLKAVAGRLLHCVRESDTVARLSGDEFVVMLTDILRPADASQIAQKLVDALHRPFDIAGHSLTVDASIGVSVYPRDGEDAKSLIKNADTAMYQAKQGGRNQFRQYSVAMGARAARRLTLENDLRRALANNEFELKYQPQVALASGGVVAVEVFLRWRRPGRNRLIPPSDFIHEAEAHGLILPITKWVLRTACAQNRAWQQQGFALHVGVNLSGARIHQLNIKKTVERALKQTGLPPTGLELELAEGLLRAPEVERGLRSLRRLGVRIAIHDVGGGYSSLSGLQRFAVDKLKIDRATVRGVPGDGNKGAMIAAIIARAHGLHLPVTAEGVETAEQLEFLRSLGCDAAQGYFFGKPLSADELTKLLLTKPAFGGVPAAG